MRTFIALVFIALVIAMVYQASIDGTEEGRANHMRQDERQMLRERCLNAARAKYAAVVADPYKREQAAQADCE